VLVALGPLAYSNIGNSKVQRLFDSLLRFALLIHCSKAFATAGGPWGYPGVPNFASRPWANILSKKVTNILSHTKAACKSF
jgi:hypothetical protein